MLRVQKQKHLHTYLELTQANSLTKKDLDRCKLSG